MAMTPAPLKFLIVEKDAFVARDMQLGLQDADAGCHVLHMRDVAECQALLPFPEYPVVITKLSIDQIDACGLTQIAGRNAVIVVREGVDTLTAVARRGWLSLASPFTAEDLAALVHQIRQMFDLAQTHRPGA